MEFDAWNLVIVFCLPAGRQGASYPCQYQDLQDLRIYRMKALWSFEFGYSNLFEIGACVLGLLFGHSNSVLVIYLEFDACVWCFSVEIPNHKYQITNPPASEAGKSQIQKSQCPKRQFVSVIRVWCFILEITNLKTQITNNLQLPKTQ
ncbi:MAG: hypothetical protein IPJ06_14300 [Saprospiraceae bacterium]|nr:hypothetical protein [Saprospiraceae bacterium]